MSVGVFESLFGKHLPVFCCIHRKGAMYSTCTFVVGLRCPDEGIYIATAPSYFIFIIIKTSACCRNIFFTAFETKDKHFRQLKQKQIFFLSAPYIVIVYPKFICRVLFYI